MQSIPVGFLPVCSLYWRESRLNAVYIRGIEAVYSGGIPTCVCLLLAGLLPPLEYTPGSVRPSLGAEWLVSNEQGRIVFDALVGCGPSGFAF